MILRLTRLLMPFNTPAHPRAMGKASDAVVATWTLGPLGGVDSNN